ncbi:antibiotic biosynthesis monooxygenase [Falsarthrobacter nasiphocae]|uniref:Heme-degrading monooxygenase HmoA n=1 Tax=Falsarthrobacter nasiphocae TaxID=189863 RepID=A0AAE4C6E2_9MICC|nr:antibiotic biosynthesis monooxygenase [Falsarthrobacter nasiphocae]MDR6892057.1 heme-degrading monooxygenase HmoA [Falsarthrobacter nasiphocae]
MIVESALLPVIPGREEEFEEALATAKDFISASPGFLSLQVSRGVESPSTYLLVVTWETLEAHTEGFRGSELFEQWRAALHHFYEPKPVVEHYRPVVTA